MLRSAPLWSSATFAAEARRGIREKVNRTRRGRNDRVRPSFARLTSSHEGESLLRLAYLAAEYRSGVR